MDTALKVVWVVSAVSLMLLILLHSPKGDGLGGFGGQGQMFASTRSAETALNRVTWGLVFTFISLSIILSTPFLAFLRTPPAPTPAVEIVPPASSGVPETLPAPTAPPTVPPTVP